MNDQVTHVVVGGSDLIVFGRRDVARGGVCQSEFRVGSVVGEWREQVALAAASKARDELA